MTWVEEWLHVPKYLYHIYVQPNFKHVLTDRQVLPLRSRTEKCYVLHRSRISTVFPITRQSGHKAVTDKRAQGTYAILPWSVRSIFEENSTPTDTFLRCSLLLWDLCNRYFLLMSSVVCRPSLNNYKSASFRLHLVWGPARVTRSWQSQRCSLYSLAEQSGT